ncbi:hypothetical protein CJF42_08875 [Pseudoalteromonas sp. NBT06-2]|uniref:hypothetical protein n=1 Tax=Pseudoalteromonas sp. NBT06-2 TaxID=2025950 RepID=UPI000BA4F250|nr:hypothetical protein [Pseudoalteromonas sp. NBT06-2]PAJ74783.1 hypothetical protein CJF42_08875 [Pseudoalteromonas sp. NBT06-2]
MSEISILEMLERIRIHHNGVEIKFTESHWCISAGSIELHSHNLKKCVSQVYNFGAAINHWPTEDLLLAKPLESNFTQKLEKLKTTEHDFIVEGTSYGWIADFTQSGFFMANSPDQVIDKAFDFVLGEQCKSKAETTELSDNEAET